jgi:hypothetical protein
MGTQFFASLVGIISSGGALLLMGGYYAYRWYKKRPIEITGEIVTIVSTLVIVWGYSAYKLSEASFHYAKEGTAYVIETGKDATDAVLDAGQEAISGTIKYFSVAVLEGVGKTYEYFEEKWDREKIEKFNALELKIISSQKEIQNGKTSLHLVLEVTNRGKNSIDLKDLVVQKLLLLKNKNEAYYPVTFNGVSNQNMNIPPATTVTQEIDVFVHDDNYPTMLSTPYQKLELK